MTAPSDAAVSRRLLVVDDNAEICKFARRVAEQMGFIVADTQQPRDAVPTMREFQPTDILLDLSMPDMDGIEVLRQLAAAGCSARILLMSGFDAFYMEAARKIGEVTGLRLAGTIEKPLRVSELKTALA